MYVITNSPLEATHFTNIGWLFDVISALGLEYLGLLSICRGVKYPEGDFTAFSHQKEQPSGLEGHIRGRCMTFKPVRGTLGNVIIIYPPDRPRGGPLSWGFLLEGHVRGHFTAFNQRLCSASAWPEGQRCHQVWSPIWFVDGDTWPALTSPRTRRSICIIYLRTASSVSFIDWCKQHCNLLVWWCGCVPLQVTLTHTRRRRAKALSVWRVLNFRNKNPEIDGDLLEIRGALISKENRLRVHLNS